MLNLLTLKSQMEYLQRVQLENAMIRSGEAGSGAGMWRDSGRVWLRKWVETASWKISLGSHGHCRRFGNGREGVDTRGISQRAVDPTGGQLPQITGEKAVKMIQLFWA